MRNIVGLSLIFISLLVTNVFAQTYIKSEIDKTVITAEELLTYKLAIISSEKEIQQPEFPDFTGFNVISSARSSTVSFADGKTKKIVVYAFILAPIATGIFSIGPSRLKTGDKTLSSDSFEVEVKEAPSALGAPQKNAPSLTPKLPPEEAPGSLRITL